MEYCYSLVRRHLVLLAVLLTWGISPSNAQGEWLSLAWMERPRKPANIAATALESEMHFTRLIAIDGKSQTDDNWEIIKDLLREGDLIAYRMDKWEARKDIFVKGQFNKVGYRLFKYGHLALVVRDPDDPDRLRLFSSQAFVGPNIRETIDTLKTYDWDLYRSNAWDKLNHSRLYEFIQLARTRGEKWYGYDFSGLFGLWNSNLQPSDAAAIGHEYICSTVVLAALHYAGLRFDSRQRYGIFDIVTPLQVVRSKGQIADISTGDEVLPHHPRVSLDNSADTERDDSTDVLKELFP